MLKFDVSFYCFLAVSIVAVAVASLRTKTIDIGYQIASLKKEEERLKVNQNNLILKLEKKRKEVRSKYLDEKEGFALPKLSKVEVQFDIKNKE